MRRVAIHFPIIVYPSEHADIGPFTAHCLNLDIIADDDNVEGAVSKLLEAIEQHLDAAEEHGADPTRNAPFEYFEKLQRAKKLPDELLERIIREANQRHTPPLTNPITAEQLEIRELQEA